MRDYAKIIPVKKEQGGEQGYATGLPIKKRNEYGEYRLKGFKNGKPYPDADYFTDDYEDLLATFEALTGINWEEYKKQNAIKN